MSFLKLLNDSLDFNLTKKIKSTNTQSNSTAEKDGEKMFFQRLRIACIKGLIVGGYTSIAGIIGMLGGDVFSGQAILSDPAGVLIGAVLMFLFGFFTKIMAEMNITVR